MNDARCRRLAGLLLLGLLAACLFAVLPGPAGPRSAAAQATSATLEDYESALREALAAAQRNDEIGLRDVAPRLGAITSVTAPDGTPLPVDNRWLGQALDGNQPNLRQIRSRLGAQVEALASARPDDPDAMAKLTAILNAPPFADQKPPEPVSAPGSSFWGSLDFSGLGDLLNGCLTVLAILVVAGVVYYIAMAVKGGFRRDMVKRPRQLDDEVIAENLNSAKAMDRASEVAVEGDFRKAVRYLYISTLLWLDERGAVRYDRTLTNREVLEAVPPGSPIRSRLTPVVGTFDQVWYGYHEIDQTAFDTFRQQVTSLREGR
ncbi:MAG TPA: DUF4129 domain-containing protein [Herpetosiphonaceae bacterium]